jgi:hypothetical protein
MLGELSRNTMALIASLIIITAIVALFAAAAQAWGVDSRQDSHDPYTQHAGLL